MERIRKQVQEEKAGIAKVRKQEGSVLKSLARIERDFDRKSDELARMNTALEELETDLTRKEAEMVKLKDQLATHRANLTQRVRALYRLGVVPSPFLLTTPRSFGESLRFSYYLEVILENDRRVIQSVELGMEEIRGLQERLDQKRTQMSEAKRRILAKKAEIWEDREKKREFLVSLRGEKEKRLVVLRELESAAQELQKLLDRIERETPHLKKPSRGLAKGTFNLPVRGEIIATFGRKKHPEFDEYVFQKGIEIQAPIGEKILCAEAGKVVFSGRLTGYGKLIIVDHGSGYFTVYAHASELLKEEGDLVEKGEAIALVGDTDSLKGPYLYFEVRKDGRAEDPLVWLATKGTKQ